MVTTPIQPSQHPLAEYIYRLERGDALLKDTPNNLLEVVGILKSYGVVLDEYSNNLNYIGKHQFLVLFPFFKYFNGDVSFSRLLKHWWHDRINYEYAEYCMRGMLWHGGGKLDEYVDSEEFKANCDRAIRAKLKNNPFIFGLNKIFPNFLLEQAKMSAYYAALGQFWRVMSDMFLSLSDRFDAGEINSIPDVVQHVLDGLVADASLPITFEVDIKGEIYTIIPKEAGLTFLMETAVPYVEAVFFRGFPFLGTVSYNAQASQVPHEQGDFSYGALYADPLPVGGAGVPPTLLMQDMRHYLPEYLHGLYQNSLRGEDDLLVKICMSFQKSMYCVTTAALKGLAPHPLDTKDAQEIMANRQFLEGWMNRFLSARMVDVNNDVLTL